MKPISVHMISKFISIYQLGSLQQQNASWAIGLLSVKRKQLKQL